MILVAPAITPAVTGPVRRCVRFLPLQEACTRRHVVPGIIRAKCATPTLPAVPQPAKKHRDDNRCGDKAQEQSDFRHSILRQSAAIAVMLRPQP
jgi:hypothetical protein